jgi:hypothetical protein
MDNIPSDVIGEIFREILRNNSGILRVSKYWYSIAKKLIPELCKDFATKNRLFFLEYFTNLKTINLERNFVIDTRVLNKCNPTKLNLSDNTMITNTTLQKMTNLTNLNLFYNHKIKDYSLKYLPLTTLNLDDNELITDGGLMQCKTLTKLSLKYNRCVSDYALSRLTNLTSLNLSCLGHSNRITDKSLLCLKSLTTLNLISNTTITNAGLANCTLNKILLSKDSTINTSNIPQVEYY